MPNPQRFCYRRCVRALGALLTLRSGSPVRIGWRNRVITACKRPLLFLLLCSAVFAQSTSDYQVKAAYLYNIAKSAQWPATVLPSATSPIVFCVLGGADGFVDVLRTTLAGKAINDRALVVK